MRQFACFSLVIVTLSACGWAIVPARACCPAPPFNKPVVNADQTVLIIWDAANKTQHFIRQASFKSTASDFGFIVPSPTQPDLAEADQGAFVKLSDLTKPDIIKQSLPTNTGCGCSSPMSGGAWSSVKILDQKLVAGYKATILEASSAVALTDWLKQNDYAFSPEVKAWAEPYVAKGWKFTALKIAKPEDGKTSISADAPALRISFKADQPLFPYREPDNANIAESMTSSRRMLRIFFVSDTRVKGEFPDGQKWNAEVAWSNAVPAELRTELLDLLKLPASTGPAKWHLTEFEHNWPYAVAPGDVYFVRDANQEPVKRQPWIEYTAAKSPPDVAGFALVCLALLPAFIIRLKR